MNAFMLEEADTLFATCPGVQRVERHSAVGYLVDDTVFVRFKLLDRNLLSRNYPTQRAISYNFNFSLPDLPATALRVDVGYRLNPLQTEVQEVLVVHRSGPRVRWAFTLDAPAEVIALPVQHSLDDDLAELPAIRARSSDAEAASAKRQATDDA